MFLSVVFGLFHGLVFLPVVLALFGKSDDADAADGAARNDGSGGDIRKKSISDIEDNSINNNAEAGQS